MSQTRQPRNPQHQTSTQTSQNLSLSGTLRLRGEDAPSVSPEPSSSRRIRWSEDVVDNEGMGKKSSKVCCIYHKARPVGESSSEESSSSSSDSDSDSETDCRKSRSTPHSHPRGRGPAGEGSSDQSQDQTSDACTHQHRHRHTKLKRKPSPNAYEKMPRSSKNSSRGT
ncbi:Type 1 phosphatases regulator ypi1 [Penicillium longicatenatum]|nr:Type 1 phosphatases regulator ypi1 [Penicillium longicatenatum]